jgi:hypothetical protein
MKKIICQAIVASIVTAVLLISNSCTKDVLYTSYTYYEPILKLKSEVIQSIGSSAARPLERTGKLVKFGEYIFVNEINKGIHIINNADPANPKNIFFIEVPGNIDIAIKNNTLYADIYTDMVVLDIGNPANVKLKKVIDKIFPERDYQNGFYTDSSKYVVGWNKKSTKDKNEFDRLKSNPSIFFFDNMSGSLSQAANAAIGITGSLARFTIVNNYLYTVSRSYLTSFNITSEQNPFAEHKQMIGWNIETIYPFKDKLFIGAQTGMFIYSLASPANPTPLGTFSHACFNDPVVADDEYAYVTLRARTDMNNCRGTAALQQNELDIVDISNLQSPVLVKVYNMTAPQGLSKDGNILFVCDGEGGLKIYNVADPTRLFLLKVFDDLKPFDVIAQNGMAIVVAEGGLYQYNYSNLNSIKRISKISIQK